MTEGKKQLLKYIHDSILMPYGVEMGTITGEFPFTGNGFTKVVNGEIIPEYICNARMDIPDGTELWEISKDGVEILRAIYSENAEKFILVE